MAGAGDDGSAEVNGVGAGEIIVPAGELVALLRRGERLTGVTVGVGYAKLGVAAVGEDAAVGNIQDAGFLGRGTGLAGTEIGVDALGQGGNSRAAEGQGASQTRSRHRATNVELGHRTTLSLAANP